jgi:rhodanese-related sulfurtransferase
VQASRAQFIDVRELYEVEIARIHGFQIFPLSAAATWLPTISEVLDSQKDTYVLCHAGVRSMHMCRLLVSQGWYRVHNVCGGIMQYSTEVDPSIPQY